VRLLKKASISDTILEVGERLQVNIPKTWSCFYGNIIRYSGCTAASGLKRVLREIFLSVQDKKLPPGKGLYARSKSGLFQQPPLLPISYGYFWKFILDG